MRAPGAKPLVLEGPSLSARAFPSLGEMLAAAAKRHPTKPFLEQRVRGDWKSLTYLDAQIEAGFIARALTGRGLSAERPLAILSQNSIEHAVIALGAMIAGIPVAPISVAYSQFEDTSRLAGILEALTPGLVFAQDEHVCSHGFQLAKRLGIPTIVARNSSASEEKLERLLDEGQQSRVAIPLVSSETIAKILFTSGSTGTPKGVIVTHGMMCSNQEAVREVWTFLKNEPPEIVDWLPWNHVFGGNLVFNCVLRNAGTLFIDEGRPVSGQFEHTIENIKSRPPTIHLSVPGSLTQLTRAMRSDAELAERFFCRLRAVFSAGAALPQSTWDELHALAAEYGRPDFSVCVGWGATETGPVVSITPKGNTHCSNLGIPIPGAAIKLVPTGDATELRVRGPMVTPGYWRNPNATAAAFDEEGYYRTGDAGRLVDLTDPSCGILFDGRVAENFKLATGTWVQASKLRLAVIAAASPVVQDVIITGHDRDEVGLLIFPDETGCREVTGDIHTKLEALIRSRAVRARIASAMSQLALGGSASRIGRALLLADTPSAKDGEITDKGYLNQRAALSRRRTDIEHLYQAPTPADVITLISATE
ncbi:AMP-binding protein [Bradyrhizobium iriomotense]|uniref:AMP-binding protein n=1 Tax=Bradyrhizobium iriomotense TaxID=441950 RepID=UPI001B8A6672|nr:AMP-binding protein [Bradyrhizobium iriomotense]MBR0781885.1 AMP-binding protein [Bradyrhizobium iriomotense]